MTVRQYGKENAERLLASMSMDASHPHYAFFLGRLTGYFERTNKRNSWLRAFGAELDRIASANTISKRKVARLRELATYLIDIDDPPSFDAVRLAGVAIRLARGRAKSNANLRHSQHVSDEQIREVLGAFDTREKQAARLGINERTLRRRLKKK